MNNPILNGFETTEVTLKKSTNVAAGKAVGLAANCSTMVPSAGKHFCGVCTNVRGKYASVVLKGFATVAYSGTVPVVGYNKLVADGSGNVKIDDAGRLILVTRVDIENSVMDIIL